MTDDSYADYIERWTSAEARAGGRRRLDAERFAELREEYERLVRRIDPDDIQLDEWKRYEELRFLLLVDDEDVDPS